MGIGDFPEFSAQRHDVSFASASHHMTQSFQSYTAHCTGTQLHLQQSPSLPNVKALEHLPYQLCIPFPGPSERIPQQQLVSNRPAQQTAATSHLTHYPPPAVKPVEPDFSQLLDHPLTPSFELPTDPEPWWEKEESLAFKDRTNYL